MSYTPKLVRSKAANRRRPGVAVMPFQGGIRNPLARLLAGLVEHLDGFPRI